MLPGCPSILGQKLRRWPISPQPKQGPSPPDRVLATAGMNPGRLGTWVGVAQGRLRGAAGRFAGATRPDVARLRLADFLSAVFSAFSILFSSSELSANSSAVYSATTLQPNSDLSAILINFCLSVNNFLPSSNTAFALSTGFDGDLSRLAPQWPPLQHPQPVH